MKIGILEKWNSGVMGLDKITTNLQTRSIEHSTIVQIFLTFFLTQHSITPSLHGIRLRCVLLLSLLVQLGDELRNVVDFNLLFSKFGISEIVQTGRTFREQNLSPCLFDDLA